MKKSVLYIGGILLVIGAMLPLFLPQIAPWVFAIGAVCFSSMQMSDQYEGNNIIIRRLRRQQILGALLLIVAAFMMFMWLYAIAPFRGGEWKIALIIAVFVELYTTFRIDAEEKKEQKNKNGKRNE